MVVLLLLLLPTMVGRAQLAVVDGFDPGANNSVFTLGVQPDGKLIVSGFFSTLGGGGTGTTMRNKIGRLNADGSLDMSFDAGANGSINTMVVQPDGKIIVGGNFTTLGGGGTGTTQRNYIGRLNADGSLDTDFNPGANDVVLALAVQSDGKILVGGNFTTLGGGGTGTTTRDFIGRLNSDGTVDTSFNPGASSGVEALAVQSDGKILLGGNFSKLGGGGFGTITRQHIGRLNTDGSLDINFNPGVNADVVALTMQPDGKILVGGFFTMLGGGGFGTTTRNLIGRLNADGTVDTGFNPGANAVINAMIMQADGKIIVGGGFTTIGGGGLGTTTRNRIAQLNADGSVDPTFNPGADKIVRALAVQADSKILVGGDFLTLGGATRSRIGRLNTDGWVDMNFDPGTNNIVHALAIQPDGKILVGGRFTTLGGGGRGVITRQRIGRLNADGSLDMSFNPSANNTVLALAIQSDGKILVVGDFTMVGGVTRNRIARLNADGSVDMSFDVGANDTVFALAMQADGKILVGGLFSTLSSGTIGTTTRNRIARLNEDGSLDMSFDPGANFPVFSLAVQPDGKIIVGGNFTTLGGGGTGTTPRSQIGRLNADGSVDTNFNPGANTFVHTLVVQPDGKIIVGGDFTMLGGGGTGTSPRNYIGRLNSDGSLDLNFNPGANNYVYTLAAQADGKVFVGGEFTMLGGGTGTTPRNRIARLNADGSVDTSYNPGTNGAIFSLAMQADGKVVAGVGGTMLGGGGAGTTPRNGIGRLTNTDPAIQNLSVSSDATIITWQRRLASPEVDRVTFEVSLDGNTYSPLTPTLARSDGGWQMTGQNLPLNQTFFIRARGFYGNGQHSGSITETTRTFFLPALVTISGTVTFSGNGLAGVTVTLNDSTTAPRSITTTDSSGHYSFSNLAPGTYTITPTKVNFTFTPPSRAISLNANLTVDFTAGSVPPSAQFSQTTYSVGEGDGQANIEVTRTGDTSSGITVDYRTMDTDTFTFGCADTVNNHGGAFARCDFATGGGTLDFAAGESSKTIIVPLIDDAYVEGDETFQVVLANPAGATLGAPATATVTIKDNDTAGAANPIFSSPFFVRQQYLDFLSRAPDQDGFTAWLSVLNNCADVNNNPNCDRILVSQSFFGSPEFQLKGFYVFRFYKLAFNRLPEYQEIIPDMSFVAGSTAQEVYTRKAQLAVNFTARPEFQTTFATLTNTDYVTTLLARYQLNQITTFEPATPDGTTKVTLTKDDLIGRLNSGTLTRAQAFRAIADSDQVNEAEFNSAFVAMQYYGYLRRKPEPDGYQAWLRVLQGGDIRTMVNGFMNSTEYRLRFGNAN